VAGPATLEKALNPAALFSGQVESLLAELSHSIVVVQALGQDRRRSRGAGAGILLDESGHLLTNAHVMGRQQAARIQFQDGRSEQARLVSIDMEIDLALLKFDGRDEKAARLGDSRQLSVGEVVFTIGHPWGLAHSATSGVVSSLDHARTHGRYGLIPIIRTDALLAPGNSGGPLLNSSGEVVGINTMIVGGDQGMAIPSAVIKEFLGSKVKLNSEVRLH